MILFFSIQVSVSKSSLSLAVFCACSTSTPSQLLQNIFQSQLTLQLMHLQLLTLQSLSSYSPPPSPHSIHFIIDHFIFLSLSYIPFVHSDISWYGNIYDLNLFLGFINNRNVWSSSFNLGITLDCKISQNLLSQQLHLAYPSTTVVLL